MSTPTSLPQVTIQTDAFSTVNDVEQGIVEQEDIWVSCYELSKPSVHGKVAVVISDEDRTQCAFKGRDGVECRRVQETSFQISCPSLHINNRVIHFPSHTINLPEVPSTKLPSKLDNSINSIDVSADGQTWVVGLGNGTIAVGATALSGRGAQSEPLMGNIHKASVTAVRFIPPVSVELSSTSRARILSGSDDFALALTEAPNSAVLSPTIQTTSKDAALPPASLRLTAHTRAVTSVQTFPGGTKAMSAGRDGTLRIWDLTPGHPSGGRQIGMVRSTGDVGINSIAFSSNMSGSNTLVALALQSGHFDIVDLDSRTTLFSSSSPDFNYIKNGPLDAIDAYPLPGLEAKYLIATGSQRGILAFYVCVIQDGRAIVSNVGSCVRNGAGISDIKLIPSLSAEQSIGDYPCVLVATTDGLPYQLGISQVSSSSEIKFEILAEYAGGPDCSPVRSIVGHTRTRMIWVAGDDGIIWVYRE